MSAEERAQLVAPLCVRDIEAVLWKSVWPTLRDLHVAVQEGIVTLTGYVQSYYYKQLAFQEVRHIPGVTRVRNLVEVYYR